MMKRTLSILVISLLWLYSPLRGNAGEEHGLTLNECISIALQQNPLILSSYKQHKAALARINQAKALPQPSLDYDSDLQPSLFHFKGSGESYLGVSQAIEFPGKMSLRGKIAFKESSIILQDIDLLKLEITFLVKQAFYGLLLSREKLRYAEQNLDLSKDFLEKTELKQDAGDVAKVEALRAQVEVSKAENELKSASNEVKLAKAMLNFLLARKKYDPIEVRGELRRPPIPLDAEELIERALSVRPEVKKIQFSLEREELVKKQGYLSYLPDFNLGISKHNIEGEGSWWDVTLSFPIPLFFWQPKKGEIAEAQANIESLQNEADHFRNAIALEVDEAYTNALTANDQIRLFEDKILAQSEEVYNMFLFSYQEGEIGAIELIEARRTLIEARKSYADALYNYGVALAALEKSIGTDF